MGIGVCWIRKKPNSCLTHAILLLLCCLLDIKRSHLVLTGGQSTITSSSLSGEESMKPLHNREKYFLKSDSNLCVKGKNVFKFWKNGKLEGENNYLDWAKCQNRHSSKNKWVMKLFFCQNPPLMDFWQKNSFITHIPYSREH